MNIFYVGQRVKPKITGFNNYLGTVISFLQNPTNGKYIYNIKVDDKNLKRQLGQGYFQFAESALIEA